MFSGQVVQAARRSSKGGEQWQRRFVRLAIFFGVILAPVFGLILYCMNVSRRI